MTLTQRRLYMLSFFITFALTAPLLIFLARGYTFDRIGKVFVHNGAITIKSVPKKVDLYLDGKKISNKMLNVINNYYVVNGVRFGKHTIECKKDGYTSWKKKIEVHSGVSTEFWNILLFPTDNKTITTHSPQNVKQFYLSPRQDDELVLYKEQDGEKIISTFTANDGVENVVYSTTDYAKLIPDKDENVEWSSNHKKLLLPALTSPNSNIKTFPSDIKEQKDYIAIDLKNIEQPAVSLLDILSTINLSELKSVNDKIVNTAKAVTKLRPEAPTTPTSTPTPTPDPTFNNDNTTSTKLNSVHENTLPNTVSNEKVATEQTKTAPNTPLEIQQARWMFDSENLLLLTKSHQLFFMDLTNPTESSLLANNVNGFDLAGDHVYYSDLTNGLIWDIKPGRPDYKQPISIIDLDEKTDSFIKIFAYDELRIALLTSSKNLYLLNKLKRKESAVPELIGYNVSGVQFSDDGKKMLYWTDKDLWNFMLRKWENQPRREKGEKIFITSFNSGIKNVQWMETFENILFTNDSTLKSAELDNRDQINIVNIFQTKHKILNNNKYIYNKNTGVIYLLDNTTNSTDLILKSITLIKRSKLFGINR
jgi:hypothetical protein